MSSESVDARAMPIDPDVDPSPSSSGRARLREEWDLLALIAVGGAAGALARWGLARAWGASDLPWATLATNTLGCAGIGALMALLLGIGASGSRGAQRVRALLGVGVLGGFTTFSTAMLDTHALLADGRVPAALAVTLLGLVVALAAVVAGLQATRWVLARAAGRGGRGRATS